MQRLAKDKTYLDLKVAVTVSPTSQVKQLHMAYRREYLITVD